MRKIVLSAIFCQLSKSLGSLFTPFYGYIFDSYLKDFGAISQLKNTVRNGKRERTESDFSDEVILVYL
jgi:hypothetical protein